MLWSAGAKKDQPSLFASIILSICLSTELGSREKRYFLAGKRGKREEEERKGGKKEREKGEKREREEERRGGRIQ